ncbi:hypothetical protein PMIN06_011145 [Paraphaeosphaeria minitans]|uniref:Cwf18 pre-mRNA splicing factor n=1 Tax=Paraphaeosphaeria minitans TaxID=565426 RepID=A0A9P6GN65_9PLEO|nr:cwf18 pre-mRNA splicing factor [Paraphaeosphaeria minitans]
MSSHEKLSAAANDRKARLAQLKSLKRKQAPTDESSEDISTALTTTTSTDPTSNALTATEEPSATAIYLSGRNYDPTTRNVKLGFDALPIADPTATLEYKAEQLALEIKTAQEKEREEDNGLDLFKLQPKKPNWDLKRDLGEKMRGLEVQTENAIARMVRERVEGQKKVQNEEGSEGEKVGMEGSELVEVMHLKEREEEEERRREKEDEDVS